MATIKESANVRKNIINKITEKLENKLTTENVDSILKLSVAYKNLE